MRIGDGKVKGKQGEKQQKIYIKEKRKKKLRDKEKKETK